MPETNWYIISELRFMMIVVWMCCPHACSRKGYYWYNLPEPGYEYEAWFLTKAGMAEETIWIHIIDDWCLLHWGKETIQTPLIWMVCYIQKTINEIFLVIYFSCWAQEPHRTAGETLESHGIWPHPELQRCFFFRGPRSRSFRTLGKGEGKKKGDSFETLDV